VLLSELLNFDFSKKGMEEPFSDEELGAMSFVGYRDRIIQLSGKKNPTVSDFARFSGQGTLNQFPIFCGSATDVADQMEEWFEAPACDGFVLAASEIPRSFEDFVRLVVPELQRRGLFQRNYAGATLRENLGLSIPSASQCRPVRAG